MVKEKFFQNLLSKSKKEGPVKFESKNFGGMGIGFRFRNFTVSYYVDPFSKKSISFSSIIGPKYNFKIFVLNFVEKNRDSKILGG